MLSKPAVERWEMGRSRISGPVVPMVMILRQNPELVEAYCVPARKYPLRLWYMYRNQVCTIIDVDERRRLVLQDLGLPYYDPLLIVEKTKGRMAEDEFWIRMER